MVVQLTKTMVASARVAHLARRAVEYGVHAGPVQVSLAEVISRKRQVVESFRKGGQRRLEEAQGVDLIMGDAAFVDPRSVEVKLNEGGAVRLRADRIFIDTGTRPARPPIPGLQRIPTLDNDSIMELQVLPEHLIVLGGGYIGLAFSQMFCRFGSKVTILQLAEQLLPVEDRDVADEVAKILRQDGIDVLLNAEARSAGCTANGALEMSIQMPDGERVVTGSHVLVAVGRSPNTARLNLQAAGIAMDERGFVRVNERLENNVPGVYTLGDVNGGPAFTHISYDDFRIVRANLLHDGNLTTRNRLVPYTLFIDPQLGRVGLTESQAREQGCNIKVAKLPMEQVARAIETSEPRGFMKAIVDADSKQIFGCATLGMEGGELMGALEIAMLGQLPYTVVQEAIFAHPTSVESLNNLFLAMDT
jgi:pyruvate/2-oxoglutarate dehydrogenase complex dihydrolipoamide dehydrogenase (E3) component